MPTRISLFFTNTTMDGVVRIPSTFSITFGVPPSMMAMQEFVVPRSIPMTLAAIFHLRRSELLFRFVLRRRFLRPTWEIPRLSRRSSSSCGRAVLGRQHHRSGADECSWLALPRHGHRPGRKPARGAGTSSADRNALHLALRLRALGRGDGEHTVAEGGLHLVRIDIRAKLERA